MTRDQRLVRGYLTDDHPLHMRRTMDQYYYHTLTDTAERDNAQVVGRYQAENNMQPRILTMVDQLWLWVLYGGSGKPDIVVTCFPLVETQGITEHPDPDGLTNVLTCVKHRLLDEPASVQTAYDLAGLIVATCSRVCFDRASVLSFGKSTLQLPELYETEISKIVSPIFLASVLLSYICRINQGYVRLKRRQLFLITLLNFKRVNWRILRERSIYCPRQRMSWMI